MLRGSKPRMQWCRERLYLAVGSPAASGCTGFSDVTADAYYAATVTWAAHDSIADGIGNDLFGVGNKCTRAQIVMFLWKLYAGKQLLSM